MAKRPYLLLLLLSILPILPAAGEESFKALTDEYLAKIYEDLQVLDRNALVDRVVAFDNRDAAALVLDSAKGIGDKIDRLLDNLMKVEVAHEEVNSNQDLAGDKFKTRTELREKMARLDERIGAERAVLERIRRAVLRFKQENSQGYVISIALKGKTWYQRGIAAHAAATYPTDAGRNASLKALKDKDARVVIQCLDGLTKREDPQTVIGVAGCLTHEVWVVQSTAAKTLGAIGSPKAVRHLVEALLKTDGRVRADINDTLKKLTGENFDPDYEVWKRWYEENKEKFEGAGAKPLRRGGKKRADPDDSSYYGIKTPSKHITYLIDISGSMLLEIGGKQVFTPKPGEEEKPTGPKIEIAKKELKNAIRKLPVDAFFNIITFNHIVTRWDKRMVKATQANKNRAYLFIRALKASGSTYTYGALREAFKLAGMGARDPNYASGVDTIFLLSDGAPTDQSFPTSKLMDPEKVLKAVRDWNSLNKVVIHAIAIDPVATKGTAFVLFMKKLADQNGGKYKERG